MIRVIPLAPNERRVLELRASGATYGDIASAEGLTINDVLAAIGIICMKLDVGSEQEAVRAFTGEDLETALRAEHECRFGAEQEAA
ncbi:LuxR C-terminal-related transcriptional regulator [Methylosinus sp. LW4]|uniref:LuxR C-terminal-related transcriptional regulator n=1 Tax=Methylosinus sp. LW4 TaxID=136993 RepID=UPI00037DB720|nr:LuxR C-terminal-related transcriptional regulator [Methylosinus sp. LW4]